MIVVRPPLHHAPRHPQAKHAQGVGIMDTIVLETILLCTLMVTNIVSVVGILYYRRVLKLLKEQMIQQGFQLHFQQTWMNTYLSKLGIFSKTIH